MFDDLSSRLARVLKRLRGEGTIKERHLDECLVELRAGLLEADVHQDVAASFVQAIRERALGAEVLASLTPAQQVVKVFRDALVEHFGGPAEPLRLPQQRCGAVLLVGLQGSGKTTSAAKLAKHLKESGRVPMLVSADFSRPAAREQLRVLGAQVGVKVFPGGDAGPVEAARAATKEAAVRGYDALIVDSAGRLHVDHALMAELRALSQACEPCETLLVADAMTGQDAVRSASAFDAAVPLTGIVLTKVDGDARGGAALSMSRVTGRRVRYVGVGEKPGDFELFHAERMASRILGMGDVMTLIERAEKAMDRASAERITRAVKRGGLTLEDFADQLRQVRKLGSVEKVLEMLPGGAAMAGKIQLDERWSLHAEALILSMTLVERREPRIIDSSRKRRIARGAGRPLSEVNRLLRSFKDAKAMHSRLMAAGRGGKPMRGLPFLNR